MKKLLILALLAIQGIAGAIAAEVSIMPQPVKFEIQEGAFAIDATTPIVIEGKELQTTAKVFAADMAEFFGSKAMKVCRKGNDAISLSTDATLAAEGYTTIEDIYHIDRGYLSIEEDFCKLGAEIKRIQKL